MHHRDYDDSRPPYAMESLVNGETYMVRHELCYLTCDLCNSKSEICANSLAAADRADKDGWIRLSFHILGMYANTPEWHVCRACCESGISLASAACALRSREVNPEDV